MTERDRVARRRLVWLLLTRGDVGGEPLHSDGLPALRPVPPGMPQTEGRAAGADDRAAAHPLRRPRL
jgi:hypothetical protein